MRSPAEPAKENESVSPGKSIEQWTVSPKVSAGGQSLGESGSAWTPAWTPLTTPQVSNNKRPRVRRRRWLLSRNVKIIVFSFAQPCVHVQHLS
jgi:hypothetical protein